MTHLALAAILLGLAAGQDCPAAGSRKDCGWYGVTESQCRGKGCCYEETPGNPYCFHKSSSPSPPPAPAPIPSSASDQSIINEYNDGSMGVGFSMIAMDTWRNPGTGGNNGMDAAGFYSGVPSYYHTHHQQAVSLVTRNQNMNPYPAYGSYGVVFHISPQYDFWKYFQVIGHGYDKLVAGPGDGGSHTPGTGDWRRPITSMGKDYAWFTSQKNEILARFNTVYHLHDYNEFDTNGLSPSSLAGVFVNDQYYNPSKVPSQAEMCNFMRRAYPLRSTPWPIYGYRWNSMYIKGHLPCGGAETANATVMV